MEKKKTSRDELKQEWRENTNQMWADLKIYKKDTTLRLIETLKWEVRIYHEFDTLNSKNKVWK